MIVTKEQQERLVDKYVKEGHTTDECIGFIEGIERTLEMLDKQIKDIRDNDPWLTNGNNDFPQPNTYVEPWESMGK